MGNLATGLVGEEDAKKAREGFLDRIIGSGVDVEHLSALKGWGKIGKTYTLVAG